MAAHMEAKYRGSTSRRGRSEILLDSEITSGLKASLGRRIDVVVTNPRALITNLAGWASFDEYKGYSEPNVHRAKRVADFLRSVADELEAPYRVELGLEDPTT